MPSVADKVTNFSVTSILEAQDSAASVEELQAITAAGLEVTNANLAAAVNDFRKASVKFVDVTQRLIEDMQRITSNPATPEAPGLKALLKEFSEIQREFHDAEGMRSAEGGAAPAKSDEDTITPAPHPTPLPKTGQPPAAATEFRPTNSREFETLADEYVRFFLAAGYKPGEKPLVEGLAKKAVAFRPRYEAVGAALNIPWWFIAGVHQLESTYNFETHLHNGDPLAARTVHVPAGCPQGGNPPFKWEDSAADALTREKLNGLQDWSLPRALRRWERYNGWGYRNRGVPTPYLWSFSTVYTAGKFVQDGVFDTAAISKQCGAATLLKLLHEQGHVELDLDVVAPDETTVSDADSDAEAVVNNDLPNIDGNVPAGHPFEAFFAEKLSNVQNFKWHEFLVKGGSHAQNGLNTDPPKELWENVVPLVRVLDRFRTEVGHPVVLTSVYRSPAYNAKIAGSADRSQHMAFTAADVKVVGSGESTGAWADRLKALRASGMFEGGIGIYNTFVHIDVRGTRADWDQR